MKLATFTHSGTTRVGLVDGEAVVDLAAAAPELPREMIAFLEAGQGALETAEAALSAGSRMETPAAESASHMFFGSSRKFLFGALATHPPLVERIQRIDPHFNGNFAAAVAKARKNGERRTEANAALATLRRMRDERK